MKRSFGRFICGMLVFVCAGVILELGSDRSVNPYDEGLIVTGASRVPSTVIS
jgi:hypothetical protein